jgi:hypothetical protein
MKTEMLILGFLGAVLILIKRIVIKKSQKEYEEDFLNGLFVLRNKFGLTSYEAKKLEQLYRLETAHFRSGQFKNTFSPGMERFGGGFPFGWYSLNNYFWKNWPEHKPTNLFYTGIEGGTGKRKTFLKFNNIIDAMATTLANARMKKSFAAWYSNNKDSQKRYLESLNKINPKLAKNVFS